MKAQVLKEKPTDFTPSVEVVAAYVEVEGKFLFLRNSPHREEANRWTVPAGKLEGGESPEEGLQRELFEETGISLLSHVSLSSLYIRKPEIDYIYHPFHIHLEKKTEIALSEEHDAYQWASVEEAEQLPLMNGGQEALKFFKTLIVSDW